jgi:hypothetical protein
MICGKLLGVSAQEVFDQVGGEVADVVAANSI